MLLTSARGWLASATSVAVPHFTSPEAVNVIEPAPRVSVVATGG
jgi:hypothetical protein